MSDSDSNSIYNLFYQRIIGSKVLLGQKFFVTATGKTKNIPVEIVNPVFIDPENKRLTS